jgi:hypothetical protein
VQHRARGARRLGQREGVLHLPEDLRLAQHHGVEARRDAEGVERGLVAGRSVEQRLQLPPRHAAVAPEPAERLGARLARDRGHSVDLDPVAGREDHDLVQEAAAGQIGEDLPDLLLLQGQLLAHRHRRGAVIHPHATNRRPGASGSARRERNCPWRKAPALSVTSITQKPAMENRRPAGRAGAEHAAESVAA